jgi:hypothetical protein
MTATQSSTNSRATPSGQQIRAADIAKLVILRRAAVLRVSWLAVRVQRRPSNSTAQQRRAQGKHVVREGNCLCLQGQGAHGRDICAATGWFRFGLLVVRATEVNSPWQSGHSIGRHLSV